MRLRGYLIILVCVCGFGGLILESLIVHRMRTMDEEFGKVSQLAMAQREAQRLADQVAQLLISTDLLFGSAETYMIEPGRRLAEQSVRLLDGLMQEAHGAAIPAASYGAIRIQLGHLLTEIALAEAQAMGPDFAISPEQLTRVDASALKLGEQIETLTSGIGQQLGVMQEQQSTSRDSFDGLSWTAAGVYLVTVAAALFWVSRSVELPLRALTVAATAALRDHSTFTVRPDGPVEVRSLASNLTGLVHSLEHAVSARTQFLANVSHELRTPLNGILGMTSIMLNSNLRPHDRGALEVIQSSSENLLLIINELLDFARYESSTVELEQSEFSLDTIAREVLDVIAPLAEEKAIALYLDVQGSLPTTFTGDPGRLRQLLLNLLSNAVKFTQSGSVTLQIEASVDNNARALVRLAVLDTGIGIQQSKLQHIFDPFTQSDAATTRIHGGSGLGLAICAKIAEAMQGNLEVTSRVGEGSTFTATLSVAVGSGGGGDSHEIPTADAVLPPSVAVVAEDATSRGLLCRYLDQVGVETVCVDSVEELKAPDLTCGAAVIEVTKANVDEVVRFASFNASVNLVVVCPPVEIGRFDADVCSVQHAPAGPLDLVRALTGLKKIHREMTLTRRLRPNLKVLLVEDNMVNQMVARRMLQQLGCDPVVANDGQEAIELCQESDYDLVLMDIQMPRMDGLSATRLIRGDAGSHQPLIVAMTANAMDADRLACREAGMDEFLSKPVRVGDLEATLLSVQRGHLGSNDRPDGDPDGDSVSP